MTPVERDELERCLRQARADTELLFRRWEEETSAREEIA
jgi:hypothetical protein